jgi:hypothetical protein
MATAPNITMHSSHYHSSNTYFIFQTLGSLLCTYCFLQSTFDFILFYFILFLISYHFSFLFFRVTLRILSIVAYILLYIINPHTIDSIFVSILFYFNFCSI